MILNCKYPGTGTRRITSSHIYARFLISIIFAVAIVLNTPAQNNDNSANEKTFELGVLKSTFVDVNINDATVAMNTWANELRSQLKVDAEFSLLIFDNTDEMVDYNVKKNLGIVILNSIDFIRLRSIMSLHPIFISTDSKEVYNKFYLITNELNATGISDLKGKQIGFYLKRNNPISEYWLEVLLNKNKVQPIGKFFTRTTDYQSESQLILAVFFGQIQAGVVSSAAFETMKELNPQIGRKIKILDISPALVLDISSLTRGSMNYSYANRIETSAINITSYPAGKEMLTLMKNSHIIPYKPEYIKSTEKLFNEYKMIKK